MGTPTSSAPDAPGPDDVVRTSGGEPAFVLTRTTRGWAVVTPGGTERTADLVEAMSLADLIAEDLGASPEPGRDVRRAARGVGTDDPAADPRDQELAVLRRSVAQLEHALATRVSVERAIGVLAAQHGSCPREAFEQLRKRARSSGRPVHDLAREVLDGLGQVPAVPPPASAPLAESLPEGERSARRRVDRTRNRRPALAEGER